MSHGVEEVNHEYLNQSGEGRQYMPSWYKFELFTLPPAVRAEYYENISSNWEN